MSMELEINKSEQKEFLRPSITTDIVVQYRGKLLLITRKNEPFKNHWALPGGYLEVYKETIEQAASRELKEETSLDVDPRDLNLLGVYSSPFRDPRGHVVSVAFFTKTEVGLLKANDDAKGLSLFAIDEIPKKLAFDHQQIIEDYLRRIK